MYYYCEAVKLLMDSVKNCIHFIKKKSIVYNNYCPKTCIILTLINFSACSNIKYIMSLFFFLSQNKLMNSLRVCAFLQDFYWMNSEENVLIGFENKEAQTLLTSNTLGT